MLVNQLNSSFRLCFYIENIFNRHYLKRFLLNFLFVRICFLFHLRSFQFFGQRYFAWFTLEVFDHSCSYLFDYLGLFVYLGYSFFCSKQSLSLEYFYSIFQKIFFYCQFSNLVHLILYIGDRVFRNYLLNSFLIFLGTEINFCTLKIQLY